MHSKYRRQKCVATLERVASVESGHEERHHSISLKIQGSIITVATVCSQVCRLPSTEDIIHVCLMFLFSGYLVIQPWTKISTPLSVHR